MRSTRLLAVVLLGSLALVGCDAFELNVPSATPSPSPTYEGPSTYAWDSACELLQGIDAGTLVDEPVGDPYTSKPSRCQMEGSEAHSTAALELYITSPGGASDFDYQKRLKGVDAEISGLGDAAFQAGGYVHVLVGDNEFNLVVIRSPLSHGAVTRDELVAAARIVLANAGW
jgi:hypothetical protein